MFDIVEQIEANERLWLLMMEETPEQNRGRPAWWDGWLIPKTISEIEDMLEEVA